MITTSAPPAMAAIRGKSGPHNGPDGGIHARGVAPAGQYGNTFHGFLPVQPLVMASRLVSAGITRSGGGLNNRFKSPFSPMRFSGFLQSLINAASSSSVVAIDLSRISSTICRTGEFALFPRFPGNALPRLHPVSTSNRYSLKRFGAGELPDPKEEAVSKGKCISVAMLFLVLRTGISTFITRCAGFLFSLALFAMDVIFGALFAGGLLFLMTFVVAHVCSPFA